MEHSPESAWGSSSSDSGTDSSSGSSSNGSKGKKSNQAPRAEQPERQGAASQFARIFGREALQPAANQEVVIPLRPESAKDEPKKMAEQPTESAAAQRQETSKVEQEREVAAEVVDKAQAQHEQEAAQASGMAERAAAENVGQLLDNMEVGLETAPAEETAEHIIDRTTDETAETLADSGQPAAEMQPLDWPESQTRAQGAPAAEAGEGGPAGARSEAADVPPWQHEPPDRRVYDEPDQTAAAYGAPGFGQGNGGGRFPGGPAAGFNPNAMPPLGPAAPAAANLAGWRARVHEAQNALVNGFLLGALAGGIFGHWLGKRGERARAERAMSKQEHRHQEQVAKYESQVAGSQAKIRSLTERQAYAARQAMAAAAEAAPFAMRTAEQQRTSVLAETHPAETRTEAPKRVEMMTDVEVHEASRNIRIGDKTLYELRETGTIDAAEERTLLRLAEQGGIEDPARKYHFDQEARRVLMRHELDPQLAQQVLQHEREERSSGDGQHEEQAASAESLPADQHSLAAEPALHALREPAEVTSSSLRQPTDRSSSPHPLVIANIIAAGILVGLLLILLIVIIR